MTLGPWSKICGKAWSQPLRLSYSLTRKYQTRLKNLTISVTRLIHLKNRPIFGNVSKISMLKLKVENTRTQQLLNVKHTLFWNCSFRWKCKKKSQVKSCLTSNFPSIWSHCSPWTLINCLLYSPDRYSQIFLRSLLRWGCPNYKMHT
jgi:hypothetical protein